MRAIRLRWAVPALLLTYLLLIALSGSRTAGVAGSRSSSTDFPSGSPRSTSSRHLPALPVLPPRPTTFVITPVTVIDGTGAAARTRMSVVIAEGRIVTVQPAATATLPMGVYRVDGTGAYLIPGLWDMHVHLAKAGETALPILVASGVTGVRDVGGDAAVIAAWWHEIAQGQRLGPRIVYSGPLLESPERLGRMRRRGTIEPIERARRLARAARRAAHGVRGSAQRLAIRRVFSSVRRDLQELHHASVRILPGTDLAVLGIYPGSSLHGELVHFVEQLGMSPLEALVSAIRSSAEFLGLQDSLGVVAPGMIADHVLLDANPFDDIRNTRRIRAVVHRGRLLDREALDRLLQ